MTRLFVRSLRGMIGLRTGLASLVVVVIVLATGLFAVAADAPARTAIGTAGGQQGEAVLNVLNRQRAANGIPPFTTDEQDYAGSWCPNEGAQWEADEGGEDWSGVDTWNARVTPYDNAPLHQQDLYNPAFTVLGDVSYKGQDCFGSGGIFNEPSKPHFYSFIQETGPDGVPISETASEGPFTPGQLVGIRGGATTGPYIILYAIGLPNECTTCWVASTSAEISSYFLTRVGGAQLSHVKMADPAIADRHKSSRGDIYGDVAYLIPPKLPHAAKFKAVVVWRASDGHKYTQRFSFTTVAKKRRHHPRAR